MKAPNRYERVALIFIRSYHSVRECAPTLGEIMASCGFRTLASTETHIAGLATKGWITRDPASERGIAIVADTALAIEASV